VNFEWDPDKAVRNVSKHKVSFDEAATIFGDPLSTTFADPEHSENEDRWITVGSSVRGRVLIVSHTNRGDHIRIISARKATPRERKAYEEEN
jgi:uncharacterized DUF497 family protein